MSGSIDGIIRAAESQIGASNGAKYFNELGEGDLGPWCVAFVRWCMHKAGVEFPWGHWFAWDPDDRLTDGELVGDREARVGDGISFDFDGGTADHVGIVTGVHDWGVSTIEGNTDWGHVARKQRPWSVVRCVIHPVVRKPEQHAGNPRNDLGLHYRMHSQDVGWLAPVHDGQTAGIVGEALRGEAIKITPPEGVTLDVFAHVQDKGTLGYPNIVRGKASGEGSSDSDPIIGTVGKGQRLEAIMLRVVSNTGPCKGKALWYQAHVQDVGWQQPVKAGQWCGTRGQGRRLEALRMWFQ